MGLGKVCLSPNHRTNPGSIRRAAKSSTSSGSKVWLQNMVVAALGCYGPFLGAVGVLLARAGEKCRAFLRKVSWHASPATSVSPEEKPGQDCCVTLGEIGSGICSSWGIFGKHISIFNLHQV